MTDAVPTGEDVRLALFDAYGTLFDDDGPTRRFAETLGERQTPLARLWRQKQLEYSWIRSLVGAYVDFWHVTGEALDYAMAALGIADPVLRARLMQSVLEPELMPGARSLLEALKAAGKRAAILSNGSTTMLAAAIMTTKLSGLLEAVLSVDEVKVYKPHPEVYRMAVERFGLPIETIRFLSANGWDAAGATAFGLETIWINRSDAPTDEVPVRPRAEVASLAAAAPLLGLG
ncbi:MAG: haloacid dehalogenase type II [Proteobacteria bacterium]|nr:haloacid dehalogenase type II [Pseudomonadota bacterium]